jgi:hypothetical protein
MCEACFDGKLEPRWVVILAGRQNGSEYVKDHVSKKRYPGNEILASELLI